MRKWFLSWMDEQVDAGMKVQRPGAVTVDFSLTTLKPVILE
jgi:hypothetical protein